MKTLLLLCLCILLPNAGQAEDSKSLLSDGLFAEESKQDYPTAIKKYQALLDQFTKERQVAAVALYRMAEIHRKQGNNQQAATLFKQLIIEFPTAEPQNRLSRESLETMGEKLPAGNTPALDAESKELLRVKKLAVTSPDRLKEPKLLNDAASKGYLKVVSYLLDQGVDINKGDALFSAADNGNLAMCKLLLDRGSDPNFGENAYALEAAVQSNYGQVISLLLEKGANAKGKRGLFLTRFTRDIPFDLWKRIVETGSDLNAVNENLNKMSESSLLHAAVHYKRDDIIKYLLDKKVSVDTSHSYSGITPLHLAVINKDAATVTQLIQAGANVNVRSNKTNQGWSNTTPLTIALAQNDLPVAKLLLKAKATAPPRSLSSLASDGKKEWVKTWLDLGANPNPEGSMDDHTNSNALIAAIRNNHPEIATLLVSKGAKINPVHLHYLPITMRHQWMEKNRYPEFAKSTGVTLVFPERPWHQPFLKSGADANTALAALLNTYIPSQISDPVYDKPGNNTNHVIDLWKADSALFVLIRKGEKQALNLSNKTFPALQNGDILEVTQFQTKDTYTARRISYDRSAHGTRKLEHTRLGYILSRSIRYPVYVTRDGVREQYHLNGSRLIFDIRGKELPLTQLDRTLKFLGCTTDTSVTLKRHNWPDIQLTIGKEENRSLRLNKGDELIIKTEKPRPDEAKNSIRVSVKGIPYLKTLRINPSTPPSLLQIISELYPAETIHRWGKGRDSPTGGATEQENIDNLPPEEKAEMIALRLQSSGSHRVGGYNIDFSKLVLNRTGKAPLQVNLVEIILAWDGTAKSAREADIPLQAGDHLVLTLKNGPWKGLSKAEETFLTAALTYQIIFANATRKLSPLTLAWQAPEWINTPVGLVPIYTELKEGRTVHLNKSDLMLDKSLVVRRGKQTIELHSLDYWPRNGDDVRANPRVRSVPRSSHVPGR